MSRIRQRFSENLINIPGWRTKRKIVVIESDDWGSIRMPSKSVFNALLKANIRVDKCPFCSYDSLATEDDLTGLFDVFESVSDINGNHPVFSANCVIANPDFTKISESGLSEYHYELITETLKKYSNCTNSFSLWKQGIAAGLFYPQLHGREHLNVNRWMKALEERSRETIAAFNHKMFGISSNISSERRKSYMAAFDADRIDELEFHEKIVNDAVYFFNILFGYSPSTFIAPNYIWTSNLENFILKNKIHIIQGSRVQYIPDFNTGYNTKRHYTGERNRLGQFYTLRNCLFEPSIYPNIDWLSACLRQIQTSFFWGKPAVIGTHRVNYIGSIVEKNRTNNLKLLSELLVRIVREWPEIEFLNSQQLGNLIYSNE